MCIRDRPVTDRKRGGSRVEFRDCRLPMVNCRLKQAFPNPQSAIGNRQSNPDPPMPIDDILFDCEAHMEKAVEHLRHELRGVRTGRATPALVEHVMLDY